LASCVRACSLSNLAQLNPRAQPGAFTPTCQANHLPPYAKKYDDFKAKGVDVVAVIATNDAFVMSAWVRTNKAGAKIVALADTQLKWLNAAGLGACRSRLL
jgi:alkyl hydroperoxide reductase 1